MRTAVYILMVTLTLVACTTPAAPEFNLRPSYLNEVFRGWAFFSDSNHGLASTSFRIAIEADEQRSWIARHAAGVRPWSFCPETNSCAAARRFRRGSRRAERCATP